MTKKKKPTPVHPGAVDSSYTVFFVAAAATFSYLIASMQADTPAVWFVIFGFLILLYTGADIVRQLFNPGEAVFVYFWVYGIFPGIVSFSFDQPYVMVAIGLYLASLISASLLELIYHLLTGTRQLKGFYRRVLKLDTKVDATMIAVGERHFLLTSYRGVVFVVVLSAVYYSIAAFLMRDVWMSFFNGL
jgi:hypothetical protein